MIVFNSIEAVFSNPSIHNKQKHNRGLIEQANEAFFIFDNEGRYIDVNSMACQLTGYTEQELLRKNIAELVPPLYRKNIGSFMTNLKEGNFIFLEGVLLCKDGSAREVEISTQMISNGRFFSSCRDISNKKTGQRTLNESGDKYLWLVEQSDDHVLVRGTNVPSRTDVSNTFQDINYKEIAETKAKLFDRFSSQQKKSDSHILTQNLIVSKLVKSELGDGTSNHPQLFAECWTQLTRDGKMITFLRDITEKRRTELSLKKSEQQYRLLFQHNPLPLLVMDLETFGFLDVNEAAVQQYGYTRDEFLQLTALDLRPKKDITSFLNAV
jgi:PAS domain S-box-containing protein